MFGSELCRSGLQQRIDVVHGCVEDQALLERTLAEYEIQTVFHLAAQTIVGVANRSPLSTFEANIKGTWCLLEAARRSYPGASEEESLCRSLIQGAAGAAADGGADPTAVRARLEAELRDYLGRADRP